MKSRLVISHIQQLAGLVSQYPALGNLPTINLLKPIFEKLKNCTSCSRGQAPLPLEEYRVSFENALLGMSEADASKFKKIVEAERFGFYSRSPSGKFILHYIYDKNS